jgi:hypothetical protein
MRETNEMKMKRKANLILSEFGDGQMKKRKITADA